MSFRAEKVRRGASNHALLTVDEPRRIIPWQIARQQSPLLSRPASISSPPSLTPRQEHSGVDAAFPGAPLLCHLNGCFIVFISYFLVWKNLKVEMFAI